MVVAGCLAQSRREEFLADFPFVDVLVGPQSLHELPLLLEQRLATGEPAGAFQEATTRWSADLPRTSVTRALRLGADSRRAAATSARTASCPMCADPEASRAAADDHSPRSAAWPRAGVREVTLLGQNVNAYGKEPGFSRAGDVSRDLLRAVCAVPGIERVRFMTSHPKDVSRSLIELMAAPNQVCEHVHLPVQSGSDRILEAMRRGYDRAALPRPGRGGCGPPSRTWR